MTKIKILKRKSFIWVLNVKYWENTKSKIFLVKRICLRRIVAIKLIPCSNLYKRIGGWGGNATHVVLVASNLYIACKICWNGEEMITLQKTYLFQWYLDHPRRFPRSFWQASNLFHHQFHNPQQEHRDLIGQVCTQAHCKFLQGKNKFIAYQRWSITSNAHFWD